MRITNQILILKMTSFCEFLYKRYETSRKKSYVSFRADSDGLISQRGAI